MNPCASRRESVALLASGQCPDDEAVDVRNHLRSCPGCRDYHRQLVAVCEDHAAAAAQLPEVRVPSRLFRRVATRIRSGSEPRPFAEQLLGFIGWRQIAGWAVLLVLSGVLVTPLFRVFKSSSNVHVTSVPPPTPAERAASPSTAHPSLLAYRLALNRSPEALEELLAAEVAKPTPGPQMAFRAGSDLVDFDL